MTTAAKTRVVDGTLEVRGHRLERAILSSLEPPPGLLVIGYGNPLRGDDGFGWRVTQALLGSELEDTDLIACHQLTPELAEPLARVDRAVFVDASINLVPGELNVCQLEPITASATMAHHLSPAHLLALARTLYGRAPQALMISVGAINLSHTERLSPEVEAAIPRVLEAIREAQGQATNRVELTG